MAKIVPFKAVRPVRSRAHLVVTRPYHHYTPEELTVQLEHNPYSFLHIVNPGYKFHQNREGNQQFELVKNRYLEFKEEGTFKQDNKAGYYIYKIEGRGYSCCGIIAAASTEDYNNNVIKKHEDTLSKREALFKEYQKQVGFNTEPVLLTYPDNAKITTIMQKVMQSRPEYEFSTKSRETHYLWLINEPENIQKLQTEFKKTEKFYIADGHHRCASSYLLSEELKKVNPNHTGKEPYNFFMSYIISESNLKIHDYHRMVTDLNGLNKEDFLVKLDKYFRIENFGQKIFTPQYKHEFSMYLDGEFYALYLRKITSDNSNGLDKLDASVLYEKVLNPVLGIKNIRNDKRLSYLAGNNNLLEIKNKIDSKEFTVGFGMLPVSMEEIKAIADQNLTMPPKTTYIEPKLRSGLMVYEY